MSKCRTPCKDCPWRVGVDAWALGRDHTLKVPPLTHAEMVEMQQKQELGFQAPMMACHLLFKDEEEHAPQDRICAGYALQAAHANLNFRLAVIYKDIDPLLFEADAPLHADFAAMIAANPRRPGEE